MTTAISKRVIEKILTVIRRWAIPVLAIAIFAAVARPGISLRKQIYEGSSNLHYEVDIRNNFRIGARGNDEGVLNVYDNEVSEHPDGDYDVDYVPLRLVVFTQWVKHLRASDAGIDEWNEDFKTTAPLLQFCTAMEALSVAAVVLLILRWGGTGPDGPKYPARNWIRATAAALLVWFSPAALADGYVWPAWSSWVPPFYLWAIFLASCDWWLCSGIVLGIGACFKGQHLLIAPVFLLWPLLAGRPSSCARWIAGFVFAFITIVAPWLLTYQRQPFDVARVVDQAAIAWVTCVVWAGLLLVLATSSISRAWPERSQWLILPLAGMLVIWPALARTNLHLAGWIFVAAILFVGGCWAAGRWARSGGLPMMLSLGYAGALLACAALFHGSMAWLRVGFLFGARRHSEVAVGEQASFPRILHDRFGWTDVHDIAWVIPTHWIWHWPGEPIELTIKTMLGAFFALTLIPCAVALALQWRRKSPRFLVAVFLPWFMFCLWPAQILSHYLLIPATIGVLLLGWDFGAMLLVIPLLALAGAQAFQVAARYGLNNSPFWQTEIQIFDGVVPDMAWGLIAAAGFLMYIALTRESRGRDLPMKSALAAEKPRDAEIARSV
jgi:hypothetical protein